MDNPANQASTKLDPRDRQSSGQTESLAGAYDRSVKVQHALLEIASLSSNVTNLKEFYVDLHRIISGLMYAENFMIALLTEDKKCVTFEIFLDEKDDSSFDPTSWDPEPLEKFKQTLTGYMFRTGEPLLADRQKLLQLNEAGEISYRGSMSAYWMGIPLKIDGSTMGVLVLQSYRDDIAFDEQDKEVLQFVSQQTALALNQQRFKQKLESYNEQLEQKVHERTAMLEKINDDMLREIQERKRAELLQRALFKISEVTHEARDMDEFYLAIHKITNGIMSSKNFYIAIYDEDTEILSFPYCVDEYEPNVDDRKVDFSLPVEKSPPTEQVLRTAKPLLINQDNREQWFKRNVAKGVSAQTWLGVPLLRKEHATGVLVVQSYLKGKSFSRQDEEILVFVAQQVSSAIERRKSADSIRAAHKQLTEINDDLEKRVDERTQELSVTNETLKKMLDERSKMQKKLAFEAFHDSLTSLPNRALFTNRLEHLLGQKRRNQNVSFSVLFMDLDRFKVINDSLGHLVGDALLQQVAKRIEECVRPKDTVARLGGDEFCVLLKGIDDVRDAAVISNRILESISKPFDLNEQTVFTSASIGVTLSNINYLSSEDVLRDADAAMYHAKESGKNRYVLFDKAMHAKAVKRLTIENELRNAIHRNEVQAYFQPVVDLETGKIISFEALARWIHPELGFVSPAEFIPVAEEIGLIHELGDHILNASLAHLKRWHQELPEAENIAVSVNFSSKQIEHHDLLSDIESALNQHQLEPKHLKVEVTESLLIENAELAQKLLVELDKRNIKVMLDDFGTGYSSLSYLHQFVLNTIKIDRSFISKMDENEKHRVLVKTIAFLAQNLQLSVVGEGVENMIHGNMLRELGIQYGQGYFYSKPLPADAVVPMIMEVNGLTAAEVG